MCPDVPSAAALGEVSAALKPPRDPLTHSPPKIARLKKNKPWSFVFWRHLPWEGWSDTAPPPPPRGAFRGDAAAGGVGNSVGCGEASGG